MPRYLILMHEDDRAWEALSADEKQRLMERYFAWADELGRDGRMRGGEALGPEGRVLRTADGGIVDGPFTETKDVLTGYFMIEADSLEEAAGIARGCPALAHGETVVVRPIRELDGDGVH